MTKTFNVSMEFNHEPQYFNIKYEQISDTAYMQEKNISRFASLLTESSISECFLYDRERGGKSFHVELYVHAHRYVYTHVIVRVQLCIPVFLCLWASWLYLTSWIL